MDSVTLSFRPELGEDRSMSGGLSEIAHPALDCSLGWRVETKGTIIESGRGANVRRVRAMRDFSKGEAADDLKHS